jgi:hypothetical protein
VTLPFNRNLPVCDYILNSNLPHGTKSVLPFTELLLYRVLYVTLLWCLCLSFNNTLLQFTQQDFHYNPPTSNQHSKCHSKILLPSPCARLNQDGHVLTAVKIMGQCRSRSASTAVDNQALSRAGDSSDSGLLFGRRMQELLRQHRSLRYHLKR